MADTSTNFFINSSYSANFDITWSFQFKFVSSDTNANGGISTFLFDNPKIDGGGGYTGLAYAPYAANKGVVGAAIGAMIYNNKSLIIKSGETFNNLGTISDILSTINITSNTLINQNFITIRFNLTDVGQTFKVAIKDPVDDTYKTISTINTGLTIKDSTFYKIGIGYASPIIPNDPKLAASFKDIHTQGSLSGPTTKIATPPFVFPGTETYYIIQSPSTDKIKIGIPDPIVDGYLLHK